jgi:lipopolysaccharide biosynthesis glycosyltransferase
LTAIHVACAADDRYAPYSAVMLASVLDQSDGHELQIHYLHPAGFSRRASSRLERLVERNGGSVTFVEIPDDRLAGLPVRDDIGITATMWLRIYLPEVLPEVERVLYLDIDTIAMDGLAPLWQTPLDDHYVAAVPNVWEPWNVNHPRHLGIPPSQAYFNSGVLLMNLSLMRLGLCLRTRHQAPGADDLARPGRAQRGPRLALYLASPTLERHEQHPQLSAERRRVRKRRGR